MTRWARSGNSQKHKKMPGDATPWKEFSKDDINRQNQQQHKRKKYQNSNYKDEPVKISGYKKGSNIKNKLNDFDLVQPKSYLKKQKTCDLSDSNVMKIEKEFSVDIQNCNTNIEKIRDNEAEVVSEKIASDDKSKDLEIKQNKGNTKCNELKNQNDKNSDNFSKTRVFERKKMVYLERLKQNQEKKGIILLPAKVERKLYNIKKELKRKGLPPALLKEILRKERRKEELKFRKTFNPSKACYNCRKPGHILADCPLKLGTSNQETGICFKCGSTEHVAFKCPHKVQGFPFAKCFMCKEQGHITRDCPSNKHGVYPNGGRCHLCGNINHLKKDCPNLKNKKEKEESVITLHTITDGSSVDAEITEKTKSKYVKKKQQKIVKF